MAVGLALTGPACGGSVQRVELASPGGAPNDNGPAPSVADASLLDRDASFFLRLDVAALRRSPIAEVLSAGQRRGGLFRHATASTFDPVDGLDAVASTAEGARITRRGVSSRAWSVVALVHGSISTREVVEQTVLEGESGGWVEHGSYAGAEFHVPWQGHTAFVGRSREIVVLPSVAEGRAQASLIEQLARPESPIDPALVFEPGKLGEIRLAASGLPLGVGAVRLTGADVAADAAGPAGVLLEGTIVPVTGRAPAALRGDLAQLLASPATGAVAEAMGLAGVTDRVALQETATDVRLTARLAWREVGRIVELLTDTTTRGQPDPAPVPTVRPVPPPSF